MSSSEEKVASEEEVGREAAARPFDPSTEAEAERVGEESLARALKILKEADDEAVRARVAAEKGAGEGTATGATSWRGKELPNQQVAVPQTAEAEQAARTAREQASMAQQAAAAQQQRQHAAAEHGGTGLGFPEGHHMHPRQQMGQRVAEGPESSAAAAWAAREQQAMMMQQQQRHQVVAPHGGTGRVYPEQQASIEQQTLMFQQAAAAQQRLHHLAVAPHAGTGFGLLPDGHSHRMPSPSSSSAAAARTARKQAMMLQRAAAAQQRRHRVAQAQDGTGLAIPDGRGSGHLWRPQGPGAQESAQVAGEQEMRQGQLAEAQQGTAARQDMLLRQAAVAALNHPPSAELCQQLGLNQELHMQLMAKAANPATRREQGMMMPQSGAAQRYQQHRTLGLDQQLHKQPMAEAAMRAAAREQDPRLRALRQAAALEQYYNNTAPAAQHAAAGHDAWLGQRQLGLTALELDQVAQAQAAQLLAPVVEEMEREHEWMVRQAAATVGLTTDQFKTIMMEMKKAAAGGQQHQDDQAGQHAAAMGLTGDQNVMTTLQQAVPGQQHHGQAEQYAAAMGSDFLLQQQMTQTEVAREQELMMMQQQQAAAYTRAMPGGGGSGAMQFLPGASANSEAFLVQQQTQATVDAQFQIQIQEEPSWPPPPSWVADLLRRAGSGSGTTTMPFVPGQSANSEAFHVQQQPQPQLLTGNAIGSQVGSSLPPLPTSLADVPPQQQSNGDDEDQSDDLIARFLNQYQ